MSCFSSETKFPSRMSRGGFTLVEIMVSLMIFVVVSGAMVSILMMSSELFRRGEFSRSANDETIAVLGAVTDDLNHLVPESGDGWFYAGKPTKSGNTMIAFTTTGQHENGLGTRGQNARTLVGLWVEESTTKPPRLRRITIDDTLDLLDFVGSLLTSNGIFGQKVSGLTTNLDMRCYAGDGSDLGILLSIDPGSLSPGERNWAGRLVMRTIAEYQEATRQTNDHKDIADLEFTCLYNWTSPTTAGQSGSQVKLQVVIPSSVLTEGCLHFSAWLALNELPSMQRPKDKGTLHKDQPDWEQTDASGKSTRLGPWHDEVYDTRPKDWNPTATSGSNPVRKPPFPSALRLSFVLTGGGRFAPVGYLQSNNLAAGTVADTIADNFRVSGLQGLPSIPGSMVRVGDEWIAYSSVRNGSIYYDDFDPQLGTASRGARRSAVALHPRGEVVRIGQSYSLVRSLPR